MKKAIIFISIVAANMSLLVFADDVEQAMSTALTGIKTDALSVLSTVAPIAIGIMGAFLVWRYGIRFFKSLAK